MINIKFIETLNFIYSDEKLYFQSFDWLLKNYNQCGKKFVKLNFSFYLYNLIKTEN